VSDFFQEIEEDLRRDRAHALWMRYRGVILGGSFALVVIVAGFSAWRAYDQRARLAEGEAYAAAIDIADPAAASEALAAIAAKNGAYAGLARFSQANLALKAGDKEKAAHLLTAMAEDAALDQPLRGLAAVKAGYIRLDQDKNDVAAALVAPLTVEGGAFRYSALEISGLAALQGGDKQKAKAFFTTLSQLAQLPGAPQGVGQRATQLLDQIGE